MYYTSTLQTKTTLCLAKKLSVTKSIFISKQTTLNNSYCNVINTNTGLPLSFLINIDT